MSAPPPQSLRLDKWLWFARLCKTRALAQTLIERGQAKLNGVVVVKTSASVRAGDTLAVTFGAMRRTLTVRGLGERRGAAAEARALYSEAAPPERLSAEDAAPPLHKTPFGLVRR